MSDAYVIQISGFTAGIVTRETEGCGCTMDGQHFSDPLAAERAARKLAEYSCLPRRCATSYSRKGKPPGRR
jgi:hypothetical protein